VLFALLFVFVFFGCTSITKIGRDSGVRRSEEGGWRREGGRRGMNGKRMEEE